MMVMQEEIRNEFKQTEREFKELREQVRDPVVLATLMHKLSEEKSSTNLLLREINAKLDRLLSLDERLGRIEEKLESAPAMAAPMANVNGEPMLSEIDEQIVEFVRGKQKATAEEVQQKFSYKGRNAASSRLNRLCRDGILAKKQVGRKMIFLPTQNQNANFAAGYL